MSQVHLQGNGYSEKPPKKGVSSLVKFGLPVLAVVVILGAVLGGVLGSRASRNNNKSVNVANAAGASSSSSSPSSSSAGSAAHSSSMAGASSTSSAAAPVNTANLVSIEPLPQWIWGQDKALGMCLGNWLSLERWMDEDWFIATAGANSWDEWDFSQTLGAGAVAALQEHYNTWIVESDFDTMASYGVNHLRIPMGFWAWIPTVEGEPYVNAGQVAQLEKAMKWAYDRSMYVIIDLHGLPGSQNGEESSGHNTTTPSWFGNTVNQGRSDVLITTVMNWLGNHPYRSVVSAIEPGNEYRPYTVAQRQEMSDFYARSYDTIQASAWPVAMGFHPGYYTSGTQTLLEFWQPFAAARATTPPSAFYTDHPYPGNFPPQTGGPDILAQVCTAVNNYVGYPVPVVITEYSLYTDKSTVLLLVTLSSIADCFLPLSLRVKTTDFESQLFQSQLTAWSFSGGAFYWSYKLIPSQLQLSIGLDYSQYSFITLINNGTSVIPKGNTTTPANAASYLAGLNSNCGAAPANIAPYNTGTVPTWTAEASALSVAATASPLQATASVAAARHRRAFRS